MGYKYSSPENFSIIGLILILAYIINDDSGGFRLVSHTMSWKEEVLLHDGQIVEAKRFYNLGGFPAIESHERVTLDETVTFALPGTKKVIAWKSDFRPSTGKPNSLTLVLLDVVGGVPYIATSPAGCMAYERWQRPNPPYILFKYDDGEWRRVSMAEFPSELVTPNVIVGQPATSLLKPFYTVAQVKSQNSDIRQSEYKMIVREPLLASQLCPPEFTGFKGYPEKVVGFWSIGLSPATSFSGNSCGFGDYYPV